MTVLLAMAFAGAAAPADQDLEVHVTVDSEEVELGKAFSLTVTLSWSKALSPKTWNEHQLSPLTYRLIETERQERDGRIEEIRRYQCHAFSLEDITLPAPVFKGSPSKGGPERVARGEALTIRVKRMLDPEAPGEVELPGELWPDRSSETRSFWYVGGGLTLAILLLVVWYIRRPGAVQAALGKPPHLEARERLEHLRSLEPHSIEEIDAYYVEASALIREYINAGFEVRAPSMTTEQFLNSTDTSRALRAPQRDLLSEFLKLCDLVKFGRHAPSASDRERLLEAAEQFLAETEPARSNEGSVES
jgi:hypothetical protein